MGVMKIRIGRWFFLAFILLTCGLTWGRVIDLNLRCSDENISALRESVVMISAEKNAGIRRTISLDAGSTEVGEVAVGDEIEVSLFDDVFYRVVLTDAMPSGIGVKSFLGEMKGQEGVKTVVVMQTLSGLTIDINDLLTKRVYQVIASPQAVIVREIDPAAGASKRDRVLVPDVLKSSASKRSVSSRTLPDEGLLYVDVLVCYDRNAKKWVESNGGGMTNFAQLAVMKMNSALVNTDIGEDFLFRLVGVAAIDAQAFDVYTALYAIDDDEPGWRDSKIFREKFGADIVSTFIDNVSAYGTTGVAWSMSSDFDIEGFSENAYNVCSVRAVAQSHTMTHEVGHNMGAGHATAVNPEQCDPGPQLFPYSAGYYFTGTNNVKYHTIMAYADDGYWARYTEAPFFFFA